MRSKSDMELALEVRATLPRAPRAGTMPPVEDRRPSDDELLVQIAGGDRDAFELLYRRYVRPMLGLAFRRLRHRGRAQDAAQEPFTSISPSAGRYDPDRRPRP